jgi:hypothetical protein
MKDLINFLLRNQTREIMEASFANCHSKGVYSINFLSSRVRLFLTDYENNLHLNQKLNSSDMSVGYHPHHCDIAIKVIRGSLGNRIVKEIEIKEFEEFFGDTVFNSLKWEYQSKILTGESKMKLIKEVLLKVERDEIIYKGELVRLPASKIHTVYTNYRDKVAWFVFEGKESPTNIPYVYSNADLSKFDDSDLCQPISEIMTERDFIHFVNREIVQYL